jgi:dihydrofolate synthase/folylpolyglutamate synthase
MTVSPHVDSITERIQINGKPIAEKLFCSYLERFLEITKEVSAKISYFELLMAFAYWVFQKEGVDYAVIETGMGGLFDASNVATREDKVCIITDIGFDHMHILGTTIPQIAMQKAGIIHMGNTVFIYKQSYDVMQAVRERSELVKGDIYEVSDDIKIPLDATAIADFQKRNWLLAYQAYLYIAERDLLRQATGKSLEQTLHTYIPGRMDTIKIGAKTVIMDGAHNGQKSEVFVSSFVSAYPSKKASVLLALKEGKELADVLLAFKHITAVLVLTTFRTSQDLPAHSTDPYLLAEQARKLGYENVVVEPDHHKAFEMVLSEASEIVVATGSFYMLSQLRQSEHLQHAY